MNAKTKIYQNYGIVQIKKNSLNLQTNDLVIINFQNYVFFAIFVEFWLKISDVEIYWESFLSYCKSNFHL